MLANLSSILEVRASEEVHISGTIGQWNTVGYCDMLGNILAGTSEAFRLTLATASAT